ncbi:Serine/threonine protein kinase [Handroanthus impetiginosus]|uniref:Serine/threonine protein kinase n=1 Tax=Handroanthus impetiginosus TaxID=429701 RepID=A0A2G9G0J2_9LAMI|nr:Serine/threonine protein kinase [Handroanthus impetiginosus]
MSIDVAAPQLVCLDGDAEISNGKLELNKPNIYRVGQVIYNGKVPLWDSDSGKLADFTTHFSFTVFDMKNALFLGLFNTITPDVSQSHIVSVEFDSTPTFRDNFSDERKLGQGGFGRVYKGYLMDLDVPIAMKKFSKVSKQGKKQYVTEVKVISMLRHRNLAQLIGWSHDQGEFLLVYEFMPNGSLDYHLFEWEQCVVHRDIKSSNVMLDSNFNVMLDDFGLARLMDHELDPQTTGVAGTMGYLAPEYESTGRASKESEVYSFGVMALEIATGRKSVDKQLEKGLVGWVWDLYGNGHLISAPKKVECLMIVGLWCAQPDQTLGPSIRQASRVLSFEADLPHLPTKMPIAMYYAPSTSLVGAVEPLITSSSINVGR